MKNHYQTLGLNNDASPNEIKKAYRFYASKLHPDKHFGDHFFEEKFKEIKEAYDILSDSSKRREYDSNINQSTDTKTKASSIFDFEQFDREEQRLYDQRELKVYLKEGNVLVNGNRLEVGKNATNVEGYERAFIIVESKRKYRIFGWILLASSIFTIMILIGFVTLIIGLFLIFKRDIYYIVLSKSFDNKIVSHSTDKHLTNRIIEAINKSISKY